MTFLNNMSIPLKVVDIYEEKLFNRLSTSIMDQYNSRELKDGVQSHLNLLDEKQDKGSGADPLSLTDGGDEIKKIVRREMVKYCEDLGADKRFVYQKLNSDYGISWWNVLENKKDWYPIHDHRNWFVSAVLYVKVNINQQPTRFKSPLTGLMDSWFRPAGRMFGVGTNCAQEYDHFGTSGQLLIFPPWLDHSVPPIMPKEIASVLENSKLPGVDGAKARYQKAINGKTPVRRNISNSSILCDDKDEQENEPRISIAFNF